MIFCAWRNFQKNILGIVSSNEMSVAFTMLSLSQVLYEIGDFFLYPPFVAHFLRRLLAQCYLQLTVLQYFWLLGCKSWVLCRLKAKILIRYHIFLLVVFLELLTNNNVAQIMEEVHAQMHTLLYKILSCIATFYLSHLEKTNFDVFNRTLHQ